MSSILADVSTTPFIDLSSDPASGLDIIGQEDRPNIFIVEGDGDDGIIGGNDFDLINAGLGDDRITSLDGDDQIFGEAGDDIIRAGEGDDILDGGLDDDILIGGDGDDILDGGQGVDIMTGGAGNDIFEFFGEDIVAGELDVVTDFTQGEGGVEDVIKISGIGENATVEYDNISGRVSVDGQDIIQLDSGLDLNVENSDGNDTWELF